MAGKLRLNQKTKKEKPANWDTNQESVAFWTPRTESTSRNREKSTISNITERSKKTKTENGLRIIQCTGLQ